MTPLTQISSFIVEDNNERGRHSLTEEISMKRKFPKYTMVWKMTFEELIELHAVMGKYIAGEKEQRG